MFLIACQTPMATATTADENGAPDALLSLQAIECSGTLARQTSRRQAVGIDALGML